MSKKCILCGNEVDYLGYDSTHSDTYNGEVCYECLHGKVDDPDSKDFELNEPVITPLEADVILNGIAKSDFFGDSTNAPVWSEVIIDTCEQTTISQLSGVVSSLSKKGLLVQSGSGKDASVKLTAEGYSYYYRATKN